MRRAPTIRLIVSATAALPLLIGFPSALTADVCATPYDEITSAAAANTINITGADGGAGICSTCIQDAGDAWNNSCSDDETPRFQEGGSGGIDVSVGFHSGANPGTIPNCSSSKCACTTTTIDSEGKITGATVSMFQSSSSSSNCQADWTSVLTHEFGHVLGLQEASACENRIMGNVFAGVNSNDCEGADSNFLSGAEINIDRDEHPCQNPPA